MKFDDQSDEVMLCIDCKREVGNGCECARVCHKCGEASAQWFAGATEVPKLDEIEVFCAQFCAYRGRSELAVAVLLAVAFLACGGKPAPEVPRENACHEEAGVPDDSGVETCGDLKP